MSLTPAIHENSHGQETGPGQYVEIIQLEFLLSVAAVVVAPARAESFLLVVCALSMTVH